MIELELGTKFKFKGINLTFVITNIEIGEPDIVYLDDISADIQARIIPSSEQTPGEIE